MVNSTKEKRKATGTKHEHIYKPRGGCKELFESRAEEVLVSGPAGTGKSRACLEKIHMICLLTPNVRALLLRKTQKSLGSTGLVTWRNHVIKEAQAIGTVVYYGGSQAEPPQYRYKNGSTVTIGGLDNPGRIMSSDYDIIYIQEATEITLEDHEMCTTRLRNWTISFQQLLMDCNPAGEKHWLKLRCNDKKTTLIESRHEDNPQLFDEIINPDGTVTYKVTEKGATYIKKLDNLTGIRYKRLRLGLWVSAEGIVYEEFDPAVHILTWELDDEGNPLPLPEDWPRYWNIDFGYVNPFCLKCYAEGPDGELYMYREIYMTQRTVEEHAKTIMECVTTVDRQEIYDHINRTTRVIEKLRWTEPQPSAVICDHDAEGRRTFEKATGLGTQPAIKNVSEGINAVKERLRINDSGYARLYFMADALVERDQSLVDALRPTCTVEEYPAYVWKVNTDGRQADEPVKKDDHGIDNDRYQVMFHDYRGKPRVTQL